MFITHPSNEHRLHVFDNLQSDWQTDRNQVVVQNNKRQQVVAKIRRLKRCNKIYKQCRVVSVLDTGADGPRFKSQPRRCRVTVLGKLLTPKQQNW